MNRARSIAGKNNAWIDSFRRARQELGTKGFVPVRKHTMLYQCAKNFHAKLKFKGSRLRRRKFDE